MKLDKYQYIVVEGPIGVGKTSLAQKLADHLGADALLEKPQENPFLEKFYQDPQRHAMSTQLFFLFQRINEIREQAQMDLFRTRTVSDYLFDKDALFARLNLSEDEFKLYQNIYQNLAPNPPVPNLVIYLQASTNTLQERVRKRGRDYERLLSDDYLNRLGSSYGDYFHHYEQSPLMMVNSENLNFVDNESDFGLLLERIEGMRGPREFFSMGSE
jgi:deoxyguanosine kinase